VTTPPHTLHEILTFFEGMTMGAGAEGAAYLPTTAYVTDNEFGGAPSHPLLGGEPSFSSKAGAGVQLLIWDAYAIPVLLAKYGGATVILGRNEMIGYAGEVGSDTAGLDPSYAVALTIAARAVTVTGNTVENRAPVAGLGLGPRYSLVSLPKPVATALYPYAATGNIFVTPSVLPYRTTSVLGGSTALPSGRWFFLNYEQPTL
jgi:hypothetical protein